MQTGFVLRGGMMGLSRLLTLLMTALLLPVLPPVLSATAHAAPITFSYTGTVSGGGEANGQTLSVTFTLEKNTHGTALSSGRFVYKDAVTALTVSLPGAIWVAETGDTMVGNDVFGFSDQFTVTTSTLTLQSGQCPFGGISFFQLSLRDGAQTLFNSNALPARAPDPAGVAPSSGTFMRLAPDAFRSSSALVPVFGVLNAP